MNEENQKSEEEIKKDTRENIKQIIFLVLIFFMIIALVVAIGVIIKYSDMLSNPLGYNLDKFGLQSCSCINNSGNIIQINAITNKL